MQGSSLISQLLFSIIEIHSICWVLIGWGFGIYGLLLLESIYVLVFVMDFQVPVMFFSRVYDLCFCVHDDAFIEVRITAEVDK